MEMEFHLSDLGCAISSKPGCAHPLPLQREMLLPSFSCVPIPLSSTLQPLAPLLGEGNTDCLETLHRKWTLSGLMLNGHGNYSTDAIRIHRN